MGGLGEQQSLDLPSPSPLDCCEKSGATIYRNPLYKPSSVDKPGSTGWRRGKSVGFDIRKCQAQILTPESCEI